VSIGFYLQRAGDPCPGCHRDQQEGTVNIGHSAGGWVFLWYGWHTADTSPLNRPLTSPTDWFLALIEETAKGAYIENSLGKKRYTLQEFWRHVTSKREPHNGHPPHRHSDPARTGCGRPCIPVGGDDILFGTAG
jgi:hypothetical protein